MPLCSRRRRVSRRNNPLNCDVGHVASYLCAAKIQQNIELAKLRRKKKEGTYNMYPLGVNQ